MAEHEIDWSKITKVCPECGGTLVVRQNRMNGSRFMGCTKWPILCQHTEPIPEYVRYKAAGGTALAGVRVVTLHVISFGAGVQTTALSILNVRGEVGNVAHDLVFADTGGEHPETYDFIERHFRPWAEANGLHLHVVRHPRENLYEEAWRRQMIPSINTRWCTQNQKVRLIYRWLRQNGATRREPADQQIGISADESHRAVDGWPRLYAKKRWPLCEMRLTRADCHRIIAEAGLPDPPKSGCWYCPFQSRSSWHRLAVEHPDLLDRAVALEANAAIRNPAEIGLVGGRGRVFDLLRGGVQLPMAFDAALENDESCTSGHCFV